MENILIASASKCTGCRTCEFVCSFTHERIFAPTRSRIHIVKNVDKGINIPVLCEHCENPACIKACPSGALKNVGGIILWSRDLCSFCKVCLESCCYQAIFFDTGGETLLKCDLCEGKPRCAEYCAPGALEWVPLNMEELERKKSESKKRIILLKGDY